MKLREAVKRWPPDVSTAQGPIPKTDLDDSILATRKHQGAQDHVTLNVKKADGSEYGVILTLPEELIDKAIVVITSQLPLTLREAGEMEI